MVPSHDVKIEALFGMEELKYSMTSYEGFEEEILRIRNENRPIAQTRRYMDWRYLGQKSPFLPKVFWIQTKEGMRIGMASLIFRPYWINKRLVHFAILGDISLNQEYRGRGIGRELFKYINSFIERERCFAALVIPNEEAQKSLISAGWQIKESFIPQVFLLNPYEKILSVIKSQIIAYRLSHLFKYIIQLRISLKKLNGFEAESVHDLDDSFNIFWESFVKNKLILGDRNIRTLRWRYFDHPIEKFNIIRVNYKGRMVGMIIFKIINKGCVIYEVMVNDEKRLKLILICFIQKLMKNNDIKLIRITLNERHPYFDIFKKMGFIKRKKETDLLVYDPNHTALMDSYRWFVTTGDKDV